VARFEVQELTAVVRARWFNLQLTSVNTVLQISAVDKCKHSITDMYIHSSSYNKHTLRHYFINSGSCITQSVDISEVRALYGHAVYFVLSTSAYV